MTGRRTERERAAALHASGLAALRAGRAAASRPDLARAVALFRAANDVRVLEALGDLAEACARLGDRPAARASLQAALAGRRALLGDTHPAVPATLGQLAMLLAAEGAHAQADACLMEAAGIERRAGRPDAACRLLTVLGTRRRLRGDLAGSVEAFGLALAVPGASAPPGARHGLAAALVRLGRLEEARHHRDRALAEGGRVYVQHCPGAPAVLIPSLAEEGNIPLAHLLPEGAWTRIWWFFGGEDRPTLPRFNVVMTGVADPDRIGGREAGRLSAFAASCGRPVLNDPAQILATRRDRLPALLAGITGVAVPPVCRVAPGLPEADLRARAEAAGVALPVLLRPAGTHGGAGLVRAGSWADAARAIAADPGGGAWYCHGFAETRGADGHWRKYRAIFVGGAAYPYHLAIGGDWLVHYFRAGMPEQEWKLAEEAAFLADPARAIGPDAWNAVGEIGRRLGLDYAGVDFSRAADGGTIIVWEANATMLVHPEDEGGVLAFKNAAVTRITEAFGALVAARAASA